MLTVPSTIPSCLLVTVSVLLCARYTKGIFYITQSSQNVDDVLQPIVHKLRGKYPSGLCHIHPTVRCFYYAPEDWHFELDWNRLNVWVLAIVSYRFRVIVNQY